MSIDEELVVQLSEIGRRDGNRVGGKNASLGEMIANLKGEGIRVPDGFATTAAAYWRFIEANDLRRPIATEIGKLKADQSNLVKVGSAIRKLVLKADFPPAMKEAVLAAYRKMEGKGPASVAVRSSATAEDLPEASFAGQLETYLNVQGEATLLEACRKCYASLFTDRAIAYRENNHFDHLQVALSVGIETMVRSDKGSSGVMFSLDTESGFPRLILITGAWGWARRWCKAWSTRTSSRCSNRFLKSPVSSPSSPKPVAPRKTRWSMARRAPPIW